MLTPLNQFSIINGFSFRWAQSESAPDGTSSMEKQQKYILK